PRQEPRLLERLRERAQGTKGKGEMAVARRVNAIRRGIIPAAEMATGRDGRWALAGIEPADQRLRLQIERGLHQARLDTAALAGALAAKQRRNDADRQQGRAVMTDCRHAHRAPPPFRLTAPPRHPAPPPPPPLPPQPLPLR